MTEIAEALAIARGSGFKTSTHRRPFPGEVHEPGDEIVVRSPDGKWTFRDFIPDSFPSGSAERSVRMKSADHVGKQPNSRLKPATASQES